MNDKVEKMEGSAGEIVLYQRDEMVNIEVKLDVEHNTVWLTQAQMAELFGKERSGITKHIVNIFKEGELQEESNVSFFHIANSDKPVKFFNLNVIISVGYRVHSKQGTQFRIWATNVLREYLLRGYAVNQQLLAFQRQIDSRFNEHSVIAAEWMYHPYHFDMYHPYHFQMYHLAADEPVPVEGGIRRVALS